MMEPTLRYTAPPGPLPVTYTVIAPEIGRSRLCLKLDSRLRAKTWGLISEADSRRSTCQLPSSSLDALEGLGAKC